MVNKNQVNVNDPNVVAKKRGRKSKKEMELALSNSVLENNINIVIEESSHANKDETIENLLEDDDTIEDNEVLTTSNFLTTSEVSSDEKPLPKKRGRKPKGGKIIQQAVTIDNNKESKPNIILHLKCSLKDLTASSLLGNDIESFNFSVTNQLSYDVINENNLLNKKQEPIEDDTDEYDDDEVKCSKENDIRDIWKKLKVLEHNLHVNNICDKKSACFWCTCDFDNPPVYIPKHYIKDAFDVYGCFCSPECATAHLMEESIDSSSKFERYHLLNNIYAKIYDYNKNIKPAPNPYYMLDKYYGNLTIQEYRALLRNERLFLVVDKPLTRVLPELHEDNDDFIINNKIIPSNTYQIKKKLQKKQTKNTILSERFGLNQ
jgi:hypothetical protein